MDTERDQMVGPAVAAAASALERDLTGYYATEDLLEGDGDDWPILTRLAVSVVAGIECDRVTHRLARTCLRLLDAIDGTPGRLISELTDALGIEAIHPRPWPLHHAVINAVEEEDGLIAGILELIREATAADNVVAFPVAADTGAVSLG